VEPGAATVALYPIDRVDENTYWPTTHISAVSLTATPGSTYFVELSLNTTLFKFGQTPRERALEGMSGLHLLH
jgi:hypothetical protein